jgi:hypothetical protein
MLKKSKLFIAHQVCNIVSAACNEVIETYDLMPVFQQPIAEMGTKEPGRARN